MKKALVLLLALSMVFGVFAAEPVANVNVSEFSGNASVTWGVDLDSKETGFSNKTEATLKLNLLDGGNASTKGDGVWGEIKIKTDGDTFAKATIGDALTLPGLKLKVDKAILHFGENAYITLKEESVKVGEYKLDTALAAEQTKTTKDGSPDHKYGIVAGYSNDAFTADLAIKSAKDDDMYSNAYGIAFNGSLKVIDNLTVKAGYSTDFAYSKDEVVNSAFYGILDYKLGLNDTFYIKPQVGYVQSMDKRADKKDSSEGELAAALLFSWGDKKDAKPGVYFLDNDSDKKVIPGISVAVTNVIFSKDAIAKTNTKAPMTLKVAFFSGEIVENLTAAAYFETKVGETVTVTDGNEGEATKAEGYEFAAGVKYALSAGEGTITPQFGIAMADKVKVSKVKDDKVVDPYDVVSGVIGFNGRADEGEILNIKAGVEFGGYVENTTFSVVYTSKNLKADDSTGTLDFTCKIAL